MIAQPLPRHRAMTSGLGARTRTASSLL